MANRRPGFRVFAFVTLLLSAGRLALAGQKSATQTVQLPPELRGAKIYHFPEHPQSGKPVEDPIIYNKISYNDINFERLLLEADVAVRPVERAATISEIYFQNVRVGAVPVHIETFSQEFKVSSKQMTELPAPLKCSVVFSDLESMALLKDLIGQKEIRITGESFIVVKLNALEKFAVGGKQVVLPVHLDEKVPFEMFPGGSLLEMAANRILDTLSDPTTTAAIGLAKERVTNLTEEHTLSALEGSSLYFLDCEYALRDPKSQAAETFSQSGTAFVVSADGKLLTAKRVIEPWKFDPQIAFLIEHYHLEVDTKSINITAWPVGAQVLNSGGQIDSGAALSTGNQKLKVLSVAPDRMEKQEYKDPDSGASATLDLATGGESDLALLQLEGSGLKPLRFADPATDLSHEAHIALLSFPFGLSQPQANPKAVYVTASIQGKTIVLNHQFNPGESGAPLVTTEGRVLAIAGGANECVPIDAARKLVEP